MSWHFKQLTASICCHKVISCSQLSHLSVFMFYHVSILSADPSSQLHHPSFHSLRSPPNFHWYPFSSNCLHSLFVRTRRHAGTCLFSPSTLILNSPPPHLPTPDTPLTPTSLSSSLSSSVSSSDRVRNKAKWAKEWWMKPVRRRMGGRRVGEREERERRERTQVGEGVGTGQSETEEERGDMLA